MSEPTNPDQFIITRKRKKYRFALFANADNCYEADNFTADKLTRLAAGRPITVEVGAGSALFSVELARRHPERLYIATDVKADRLQLGANRALEQAIANVVFVRVHTDRLAELLSVAASELWLTFSDPFPKTRHAKHRLTHPHFLELYHRTLTPDGILRQKTDNHAFFDWSLEQFVAAGWHVSELSYDLHSSGLPDECKVMTTYETRYTEEGASICYLSATPPAAGPDKPARPTQADSVN